MAKGTFLMLQEINKNNKREKKSRSILVFLFNRFMKISLSFLSFFTRDQK